MKRVHGPDLCFQLSFEGFCEGLITWPNSSLTGILGLGDIDQAQQEEACNLMVQLATENKCAALQILVQQVSMYSTS